MPVFTPVDFDPFAEEKAIEKITFTNEPQREMWVACIIGGEDANLSYNESVSLEIKGDLNFPAFKQAVNDLVLRHEALRSTISPNGETLIIYKDFPVDLNLEDISNLSETEIKKEFQIFLRREIDTPLDLQQGQLFKVFLHKTGNSEYFFTIIKHHIIGDGWSTGIMLEDLSKMYNAYSKNEAISLDKASQISDYASSQASFKLTKEYKQTEDYWLDLYKDNVPQLDLPTDRPRLSPRSYKAQRFDYPLSNDFANQVKTVGAKAGASLVTTLLAAFEVFLYQVTHQKDIVVGLPSSGQAASGLNDVVGHCVNLLPLKSHIDPDLSFTDYLKHRKKEVLDAYDHQRFTFGELIKKLYIPRDASRIALVPVIFNIDMGMDNLVRFDGLDFKLISNPRSYENFELYLNATRSKEGIILEWSYSTGLFEATTIEKFNNIYQTILVKIVADPNVTISSLVGWDEIENTIPLQEEVYIPSGQNINTLIEDIVKNHSNKTAVSFNENSLTYRQLDEKVNQLTAFLIQNNIQTGDIVALSVDRSIEMLVCLLAILRSGAAYLPLDPEYPLERIEFMLEDSSAKMLFISAPYKDKYTSNAAEVVIDEIWPELISYQLQSPVKGLTDSSLAYVIYTSGSTGKPKGVKITHKNLVNFLLSMQKTPGIKDTDRLLAITTISFDIAGLELYLPLITGAELVIASADATKDGRLLLSIIEEKNISMMQATPSTWQMMLDSGWQTPYQLKALAGGEALPKDLAHELLSLSDTLWNMYGPTETTIWSAVKQIMPGDKTITIGKPIDNTQVYIMNEKGKPVPTNETGEIYIGGEGVAEGYLNRSELTAEKFVEDAYTNKPGSKLYRTGDLGKILANGEIQCLGRIDHQVKIRGHRIELGEIESIISKQDGIKQSVVLAREDTPMDKRLIAYVTLNDGLDKSDNPSWKDRWDTLYDIGAEIKQNSELSDHNIDGTLLDQLENSEDLAKQKTEWLETSVARIKELKSKRIYEIGSGAGQILFELAPGIEYYMATDYAQTAIVNLNETLQAEPEKWAHVEAGVAAADDFSAIGNASVDLVLIHSVAQYFPNTDYMIDVIGQSVNAIKNGGCIFVGDMQGKNSLEMFHAMDQLPRASDSGSVGSFKEVVANRLRIDEEYVADPAFFYTLPKLFPEITCVDVQLRRGASVNEITKYHYDVWLYVSTPVEIAETQVTNNWNDVKSLAKLEALLKSNPDSVVEIKNVVNARTAKDHKLSQLLNTSSPDTPLAKIKSEVDKENEGLYPDLFWELGDKLNYNTHLRWTTDGTDGLFDVIFIPASQKLLIPASSLNESRKKDIYDFARAPLFKNEVHISKEIVQGWKENLNKILPAYMVPDDFIGMKGFPLTPNAKIDRKALPKPQTKKTEEKANGRTILTKNEQLVTDIWAESLGLENLKPSDDFFELGGHSLLAVKVMVAIEKKTGERLPLATLFTNSTIEKLASQLSGNKAEAWDTIVPIKTTGTKPPLFLVHGSGLNLLMFKSISDHFDEDQPLYGIQAIGLTKSTEIPDTVEGVAAYHIKEILNLFPEGPYAIAGYSYGGFIGYEMARQLIQAGKKVKFIGMVDTNAAGINQPKSKTARVMKKVTRQFHKVPFFVNSFMKYPGESFAYQQHLIKKKFSGTFSAETTDVVQDNYTLYEKEIWEKYNTLIDSYVITPLDVEVALFRVEKRLYFLDDRKYLGWDKLALKGVKIYIVPGDHKTFLEPPNDKEVANIINKALDNSQ